MFLRRINRSLLALAVLLNVAGGPMAFAHAAASGHSSPAPASFEVSAQAEQGATAEAAMPSEHCSSHAKGTVPDAPVPADDDGEDCCADGQCVCAAASSFAVTSAAVLVHFARFERTSHLRLGEPLSAAPSDPLRPPIV